MDNNHKGMRVLSLCILHLISVEKKETIRTVEKEIEKGHLVAYLYEKYPYLQDCLMQDYIQDLDNYFAEYDGFIEGNENRKYAIEGDDNGLLLILALIADILKI